MKRILQTLSNKLNFVLLTILLFASANMVFAQNEEISQSWLDQISENIRLEEYNITFADNYGKYQSPNRANNMRFIYKENGFTVIPRQTKIAVPEQRRGIDESDNLMPEEEKEYKFLKKWEAEFTVTGYGRRNSPEYLFGGKEFFVNKNAAKIEDENMRLEYTNAEAGMRQNFIIKKKPRGKGNLSVLLNIKTAERLVVGADALILRDSEKEFLKYGSLKIWDAEGNDLHGWFDAVNNNINNNNKEIAVVVNDREAVYPITIDPLSTSPDWTAESNQADAWFGWSVSTAGDVNGDGYSDVIVGAGDYDNGETNEGRAFVYHGSASGLSTTASWTAESNQILAHLGRSVSTAGDVNGDGYSDVIVGALGYDNDETDEGRAYVYRGSASGLSTSADWIAEGNQTSAWFGESVSTAGDVNGDGYSDVIVGASHYDNGENGEGRAFVYYGSASGLSATEDWTAESNQSVAYFGNSVSTAGDVNGDGYSDVIVGAWLYDNNQADEGRAYVYHGSPSGLAASADWTAESNQDNAYFGKSVSTAGDVNGDGYSDVIVGANEYDNGESYEGRAFVYYGSASGLSATENWTAESNQASAYFGGSVSTAGDVNGDGYSDVIIGAVTYDNGETDEGRAFVYYGSVSGLSASANWTAESNQANAYFGSSVSTAGDVNGDGYSDVIIGADAYDNGETDEGRAYVYHGSPSGLAASSGWTGEIDQASAQFGISVSGAGDVNGDGYADVIVGASYYDNGQTDEGAAFIYHGSSAGLPGSANITLERDGANAHFGHSVSTAGDVNGDGYCDVVVGAPYGTNGGESNEGLTYVFYGSSIGISPSGYWLKASDQQDAYFGWSVSTAGDVNGDGYSDIISGAKWYDNGQTNEGKAYVYYGSSSGMASSPAWTAEGNQSIAYYGESVSCAGDVNGDGFSDVIVGAYYYDNGESNEGNAFVYHGSVSGLSTSANATLQSDYAGALFGSSVSCAGDVNGDGYDDVIVGAESYDGGNTDEGKAYLFLGSGGGLSTSSSWSAEGNNDNAFFGYSVSGAGDVNGDGYSDVIVGAYKYTSTQTYEGGAFLYHGSSSGLSSSEDWSYVSGQNNAQYGVSVAGAGDINGDGYSDVIVGSNYYDNGQSNEGRAFVYYGNEGTGLRSTLQQYEPSSSNVIGPGGLSGSSGQVRLNLFGKSPFGRADGKLVYEYKQNGQPFSSAGGKITNSVSSTGSQSSFTDLGATITGVQLNEDCSGITTGYEYKWRARMEYSPVNNPYQKYGPWKYYCDYNPNPPGCFKAQDGALPVELSLFTAALNGNEVLLSWRTETEVDNYGFEIERKVSLNSSSNTPLNPLSRGDFETIGFVQGYGNSNSPKEYSFIDAVELSGTIQYRTSAKLSYRLKQIDTDGSFEYSEIVEVELSAPEKFELMQNYPNPFSKGSGGNPATTIKYTIPSSVNNETIKVKLIVYDALGAEVSTLVNKNQSAGRYEAIWNAENFPSGIYFYSLQAGSFYAVKKMSLIK